MSATTARPRSAPPGDGAPAADAVRALHVLTWLNRGGIETWLVSLLQQTDRDNLALDLCCKGATVGEMAPAARATGARVFHVPMGRWGPWSRRFRRELRAILTAGRYDVVHSHLGDLSEPVLDAALEAGVPQRVVMYHVVEHRLEQQPLLRLPLRLWQRRVRRAIADKATLVLGCSESVLAAMFPSHSGPRFGVLQPSVDVDLFASDAGARTHARQQLGVAADVPVIVNVGNLGYAKNQRVIIDVARRLAERDVEALFVIVGEGPLRSELEAAIGRQGVAPSVRLLGLRRDVATLLQGADLALHPSVAEGLPVSVLEYQAAGLPVVGSTIAPVLEALEPSSRELARDPGDAAAIADVVHSMLKEPAALRERGARARAWVANHFATERCIERLQVIYSTPPTSPTPARERLCLVTATDMTLRAFLVEHVRALAAIYDLTLVSSFADADWWHRLGPPLRTVQVPIARPIAPWRDLTTLVRLFRFFRRERFDLVHSVTPKAGLLSALAGAMAGVPVRIHTFTGQVWATRRGLSRRLLKGIDAVLARLVTDVLVDGAAQRTFLEDQGVVRRGRAVVLGDGSLAGVDTARFKPDLDARERIRQRYDLSPSDVVYLFLGRLTSDKGVLTLARAFAGLHAQRPHARLLLVGPDEEGLTPRIRETLGRAASATRFVGYTEVPEQFMAAADILCLPTRREGFGTVLLEAAGAGVPSIASDVYGVTDAIENDRTGFLVPVDDAPALRERMRQLADDPDRRRVMGDRARARVLRLFPVERMVAEVTSYYARRLAEVGR